jgi:hypothetical protein
MTTKYFDEVSGEEKYKEIVVLPSRYEFKLGISKNYRFRAKKQ